MGILSSVFGDSDNANKLVDGAISAGDKLFFTKEEKADANAKVGEWYLKYLNATQPQNVARRMIAFIVVVLWAALVIFGVAIRWASYEMSDFVFKVIADLVLNPFLMIMGFYFLTHAMRTYGKDK